MSNCCQLPMTDRTPLATHCPASGTAGRPVDLGTVKALLTEAALGRLEPVGHRFCLDPRCDVVYFDEHGGVYTKGDLRVPVWQKEPFGARVICYCFGENEAAIAREITELGASRAVERVRAHVAAGRCACEVRSPRGVCCLGDLGIAVKRVAAWLAEHPGSARS